MYEYLIGEYVKKLSLNDVLIFAKNNNIEISIEDAKILLHYSVNHYKELISSNPNHILKEIKTKIDPITYDKAYSLYLTYRNKYLS